MFDAFATRIRVFLEPPAPDDVSRVAAVARSMGISEFRLFERAWQEWHGAPAPEKQIEKYFVVYMFQETVPEWVRHFVRRRLASLPRPEAVRPSPWPALFPADLREWGEPELLAILLAGLLIAGLLDALPI